MTAERAAHPIFIAGSTGVGKSAVALWLADRLGGEIISVDSMQVYRGMDIGTAKPSREERERVPHHLVDVAELNECFDAARFCRLAADAVSVAALRGRRPIFCGGTGLYFKAWLEGLGEAPPSDPALRDALAALPVDELLTELRDKDPQTWERIDRKNPRRVIRAVEVIRLTGKPFSAQRSEWSTPARPGAATPAVNFFHLTREPAALASRIATRVEAMFAAGWVEETRGLLGHGLAGNPTAMQAIGYRQIVEWLGTGGDVARLREQVIIRTRQYARRQGLWFRRQSPALVFPLHEGESAAESGGRILPLLQ